VSYECYGPGGTGFVIECLTDNLNRTSSEVKAAINKSGCKVAEPGSVMFNFARAGQVRAGAGHAMPPRTASFDNGQMVADAAQTPAPDNSFELMLGTIQ
jgi:transcriptional/translational regulatory protein YebC/TACO1